MSFLDDLKTAAEGALKQLPSQVAQQFIKVGQPANGNLTAQQIAAGQTGSTAPVAQPSGGNVMNSISSGMANFAKSGMMIPILAVAGLAALVILKKGRR